MDEIKITGNIGNFGIPILPGSDGIARLCPELLTEHEAVQFLRLDVEGPDNPTKTLQYYREQGLLRGTRVGKRLRYQRKELLSFLDKLTERTNGNTT